MLSRQHAVRFANQTGQDEKEGGWGGGGVAVISLFFRHVKSDKISNTHMDDVSCHPAIA